MAHLKYALEDVLERITVKITKHISHGCHPMEFNFFMIHFVREQKAIKAQVRRHMPPAVILSAISGLSLTCVYFHTEHIMCVVLSDKIIQNAIKRENCVTHAAGNR
jgi:hypothetical protein